MKVDGKIIAITGAGRGIGAALAKRFAREGCAGLILSDIDEAAVCAVADAVIAAGGDAIAMRVDVSVEGDIRRMAAVALQRFGRIDMFCSNAGIMQQGGPELPDTVWQSSWSINVMAHVYATRAVLNTMITNGGGYLLNTASSAGLLTSPGAAPYAVTKSAAIAYAEWLAMTYGDNGIRVSVLCPQAVRTDMLAAALAQGSAAARAVSQGAGVLSPEDVTDAVIVGLEAETFLILPHSDVAEYTQRKAQDRDRWLAGMRKMLRKLAGQAG
jgi:NAD(P)-dependent dehydrogenase (short-subunit alcohol dehydrogenase family)